LLGLARLYDRIGRYDEALIFYGRAAQVDKNSAAIQNDLGLCLARADNMKDAAAALRRAVALDPKKVLYRNNLATVLIELDRSDEAYQTLVGVHGEAVAHYNVGYLLAKRNRKADALRHFEQALASDPNLNEARQWIASLTGKAPAVSEKPAVAEKPKVAEKLTVTEKPAVAEAPKADLALTAPKTEVADSTSAHIASALASSEPAKRSAAAAPASSPLVEVNAAEIPRPSIAKSSIAPAAAPTPVAAALPGLKTEPETDASVKGPELGRADPAVTAPPAGLLDGTSPRRSEGHVPPSPEQVSSLDVAATVGTNSSAAKTTAPKFPPSRY
jgi:Flp pilus assembly protein TadD